jgi:hypothetical protein
MKAVVVSSPGALAVAAVPDPAPGPGELVPRLEACGIAVAAHETLRLPEAVGAEAGALAVAGASAHGEPMHAR